MDSWAESPSVLSRESVRGNALKNTRVGRALSVLFCIFYFKTRL